MAVQHRPLEIKGFGLSARMMPWGATLMDLRLKGHDAPLVLGFDEPDTYPKHSRFAGATAGRFANRIAQGRFEIDGKSCQTDQNFLGKHTLHGGSESIGKRPWTVGHHGRTSVLFLLHLKDGDMGFPGGINITARFSLEENATLRVKYTATCTAPTLCNLAHHSYFCLDDTGDIRAHRLQLDADHYLPVDDELIPTGEVADVTGTRFDFRAGAPVVADTMIDHNLCLGTTRESLRTVGRLWSEASGVSMQIATTEPGMQVFDTTPMDVPVPGIEGRTYGAYAGVALEPQVWPDAPNHDHFPSAVLRPGEVYEQITEFSFSKE